jgi:hypothetical protein
MQGRLDTSSVVSRPLSTQTTIMLSALVLTLGTAACGGGGSSAEEQASERQALTRWQGGLTRWRADMLGALNGISILLSDAQSVDRLHAGDERTIAKLHRLEARLSGCRAAIARLGAVPELLAPVRAGALRACRSLRKGAELLRGDFSTWRAGPGGPATSGATESLSDGQRGVEHVQVALKAALGSRSDTS